MEFQQSVQKVLNDVRTNIVQNIKSLNSYAIKNNRQQMKAKLKIILSLVSQNNQQQLQQQLKDFNDQDLNDVVKQFLQRQRTTNQTNNSQTNQAKPQSKPQSRSHARQQKSTDQSKKSKEEAMRRGNSLLKTVVGRFIKTDENVKKMILPEKQQKCTYDPIKGKYVFQGQEEQQPKQIPKPPPARKNASLNSQPNAKQAKKKTEIEDMMAPPAFKRKGAKKKQQPSKQKQKAMNFQTLQQKVCAQLQAATQKLIQIGKEHAQQRIKNWKQVVIQLSPQVVNMLKNCSQQIRSAQQISDTMMTRLFSSYIDSQFDKQLVHKMTQQLSELEKTNEKLFSMYLQKNNKLTGNITVVETKPIQRQNTSDYDQMKQQVQILKIEKERFKKELEITIKQLQNERQKYDLNLDSQVKENSMLKAVIQERKKQVQQLTRNKTKLLQQIKEFRQQMQTKNEELKVLRKQNVMLKQKLVNIETNLQQQQKNIIQFIMQKSSQSGLVQELNEALIAENQIYLSIQAKRISLSTQGKQPNLSHAQDSRNGSSSLLELSQCLTKVVQHYESQIGNLKKQLSIASQSYQSSKFQFTKIQQNLNAQNQSLHRSLNRIKSQVQDYKQSKQQFEIKIAQLQNQNQTLQRQLGHLRKEHNYTKQVLQQNIRSSHDNTATMKEQLEAQIKALEEQLQEKQINIKVMEQQIKETSEQIQQLVKQSKMKSIKIGNLQKQHKIIKSELTLRQERQQQMAKTISNNEKQLNNLQSKINDQKSKNQAASKNQKHRMKQINEEMQGLKSQLKQANKSNQQLIAAMEELKQDNLEIMAIMETANKQNEDLKKQIGLVSKFQEQNQSLRVQLNQYYTVINQKEAQYEGLYKSYQDSHQSINQLKAQVQQYKQLYSQQTSDMQNLLDQLALSRQEFQKSQSDMIEKYNKLMNLLTENQQQTELISKSLGQYETLTKTMNRKIEQLQENNKNTGFEKQNEISGLNSQIDSYKQKVRQLQVQLAQLNSKMNWANSLQGQLSTIKSENLSLRNKLQNNSGQLQQMSNKLKSIDSLKEQRNYFQQITFSMEKELQNHESVNAQLKQEILNGKQQIKKLNEHLQQEKKIGITLKKILQQKSGEILHLKGQKNQLQKTSQQELSYQLQMKIEAIVNQKNLQILRREQKIQEIMAANAKFENACKSNDQRIGQLEQNNKQLTRQLVQKQKEFEDTMNDLLVKLDEKQTQLQQQLKRNGLLSDEIQRLSKDINQKSTKLIQKPSSQEDSQKLSNSNLSIKDKLILNIQSTNLQIERMKLQLLNKDKEFNQNLSVLASTQKKNQQLSNQLEAQQKLIMSYQTSITQLQNQLRKYALENQELQQKVSSKRLSSQDIQKQIRSPASLTDDQQEMQQLILVLEQTVLQKSAEIQKLNNQIQLKDEEISRNKTQLEFITKQKNQIDELYKKKSQAAQFSIQRLQMEVRQAKKIETKFGNLQAKYKDLQIQNMELLNQKSQILKTKDQILNKLLKLQKNSPIQQQNKILAKQNSNGQERADKNDDAKSQSSILNGKNVTQIQSNQKPAGFFGAFSSLFLTPTETQKLSKNKKQNKK